jgi:hypothetical protein
MLLLHSNNFPTLSTLGRGDNDGEDEEELKLDAGVIG